MYLLGNLNTGIWESFHFEDKIFRFTVSSIQVSENSPALSLSETDSGPVESESSQTGATTSDLEPSVSTTNIQQNIEPPYPNIAKLTVMEDTVKRKLLSSKWNDSHIFKFSSRYIN
jgi:hypothetical protein